MSSAVPPHPPRLEDEDCYEEAEPFVPASHISGQVQFTNIRQVAEYHKFKAAAIAVHFKCNSSVIFLPSCLSKPALFLDGTRDNK